MLKWERGNTKKKGRGVSVFHFPQKTNYLKNKTNMLLRSRLTFTSLFEFFSNSFIAPRAQNFNRPLLRDFTPFYVILKLNILGKRCYERYHQWPKICSKYINISAVIIIYKQGSLELRSISYSLINY